MGGCMSRIEKEMGAPPVHPSNWEGLSPKKLDSSDSSGSSRSPSPEKQTDGPVKRWETPSGIKGLTYDQCGRPVWRDPKLAGNDGAEVEHREKRR